MSTRTRRVALSTALLAACTIQFTSGSQADDKHKHSYTGAAFGRGLNTVQPPGNPRNNVVLPTVIDVNAGGVVNFAVAGFHDIVIFKPGIQREDLDPFIPTTGLFIFPSDPNVALPPELASFNEHLYYRGLNPAGGPPPGIPVVANPSNASNRSEPVAFLEPGVYLVICNVRTHLLDGMYAYVRVKRDD